MNCANPECGENTVISEFRGDGTVARYCSKCKAPVTKPVVSQPTPGPIAASRYRQQRAKSLSVVSMARTELAELRREIKRLKGLEKQAAELERLLKAAKKPKPERGTVLPLRKQG